MKRIAIALTTVAALVSGASANTCQVGMTEYNRLKTGMTLSQAETVTGCKGEEISQSEVGRFTFTTVSWDGRSRASMLMVVFDNGKILSKSQVGLK